MPVERVHILALTQVPELESSVVRGRDQVAAVGMEGDGVDTVSVCVVVLNKPLAADIPDLRS